MPTPQPAACQRQISAYHALCDQLSLQIRRRNAHSTRAHRLPLGTSKNVGFPCVSACPPKGRVRRLSPKSDAYRRTLIKIGKMENLTVRYRASPTPARSEPWRPLWIPRGHLKKTLVFLVFLRRRLWNSAGGHSPHDADLTLIVKT